MIKELTRKSLVLNKGQTSKKEIKFVMRLTLKNI